VVRVAEPSESLAGITQYAGGLISAAPLSAERRELVRRESEREAESERRAAELRAQLAAERLGELRMQGREPRTQAELFAQVSWAQDRQDQRDQKADEAYREKYGLGRPRQWAALLREAKAEREAEAAAAEVTPASEAEVERKFDKLKTTIENTFGKRLLK
jgi:hypothetical protein